MVQVGSAQLMDAAQVLQLQGDCAAKMAVARQKCAILKVAKHNQRPND